MKNAAAFAGLAHLWGLFCPLRLHIPMQQLDPTVCRAFLPRRQLGLVRTLRGAVRRGADWRDLVITSDRAPSATIQALRHSVRFAQGDAVTIM